MVARVEQARGGARPAIACAGSGKTEVVARRVVHLLSPGKGGGLAPRNIIAFTFTDKVAAELKERIITRCREALGEVPGLAEMFVGTIHAFCLELLKSETPKYLKFEVLNEMQQGLHADRHSKQSGLTMSTDLAGVPLKRYKDTPHYLAALSILREAEPIESALAGCSVVAGLEAYRSLLDERSYLDYSAILEAAVDVMANEEGLRQRLADRVRYVIVDEYQDVNPIQEAIVWLLHELGVKLCVVGDDDWLIASSWPQVSRSRFLCGTMPICRTRWSPFKLPERSPGQIRKNLDTRSPDKGCCCTRALAWYVTQRARRLDARCRGLRCARGRTARRVGAAVSRRGRAR